ncbi:ubiquitin carboxyl-terminal hydrolase family protein, putative, partial [Ichthyophthirius multifiliis]
CYMNSFIQALFMSKEMRYRILNINLNEIMTLNNNNSLQFREKYACIFQLQKLFVLMLKSKREYVNPKFFKDILPDYFRFSFAQHDASEFGRIFLDQLEVSIKDTQDKGISTDAGHYYSYALEKDNQWIKFDDACISEEKENINKILNEYENNSITPYLLFYQNVQHVKSFQENFAEFKLKERLLMLVENDEKEFMKEIEAGNKAFSALNTLQVHNIFTKNNNFNKKDDEDNNGNGGGFGGFNQNFNNAIF